MRSKFRYHGHYSVNEIYANNQAYYQSVVEQPNNHLPAEVNLARRYISNGLDHSLPHNRLVAHKVMIQAINHHYWIKSGSLLIPKGNLEHLVDIDLGTELVRKSTDQDYFREEIVKPHVKHRFPDGTYIKGNLFRKVLVSSNENLEKFAGLVDLIFDAKSYRYEFRLKPSIITNLLIFTITSYVQIDEVMIKEERETVFPGYSLKKDYFSQVAPNPDKFKQWIYSKVKDN